MTLIKEIFSFRRSGSNNLASEISAGIVVGLTEVVFVVSMASLLFSGELSQFLSLGVGVLLTTSIIAFFSGSIFSSFAGINSSTQDIPSLLLALMLASFAATAGLAPDILLATALAGIAVTAFLTGLLFFTIGRYQLTRLVRYIPYPVIGGFLAGSGWLIFVGGLGTLVDFDLTLSTLPSLLGKDAVIPVLSGLSLGIGLWLVAARFDHPLALPATLGISIMLFYAALFISGLSSEEASAKGLLIGTVVGDIQWQPLSPDTLINARWDLIIGQAGTIATILMMSLINLTLNLSGLEVHFRKDIDMNVDLRASGLWVMFTGLMGGAIGFQDLSFTLLNDRLGGRGRISGIVASLVLLVMALIGSRLLPYFPVPVVGGLLIFLGLDLLETWVLRGLRSFRVHDYAIIILILFTIIFAGFLEGMLIGLITTTLDFVRKYGSTGIFHSQLSGSHVTSHVERNAAYERQLKKMRPQIHIIELEGFLFFGTAHRLLEAVKARLEDPSTARLHYLVLDFRLVRGLDSSAMMSFSRLLYLAQAEKFTIVITNLKDEIRKQALFPPEFEDPQLVHVADDLDHGMEWIENQLLEISGVTRAHIPAFLQQQLVNMGMSKDYVKRLKPFLEVQSYEANEVLIRQGEEATNLYFLERGQVSVYLENEDGSRIRLRTNEMGTIVGELNFYMQDKRTATVITDMESIVHSLTRESLEKMQAEDPEFAAIFHEFMVRIVSQKLRYSISTLAEVMR